MTREQIKTQIEALRKVGIEEKRLIRDNSLFSDSAFDKMTAPAHEVAYFLLQHIVHIPDRIEENVYTEFENYMYGYKHTNIEQLLNWIEMKKRE